LILTINDIDDLRIRFFRSLKTPGIQSDDHELILIEGERVFRALLNSKLKIRTIFALPDFYKKFQSQISQRIDSSTQLYTSSRELMDQIIGFKMHKGILALAEHPGYSLLQGMGRRIIALNGIVDSENVGAIIRNAAAFGINSIIFDSRSSSPFLRRSVRVSAGTILDMNVNKSIDLVSDLEFLKDLGYSIYSAELDERSIPVSSFIPSENFVIVFGSEGHGIDEKILNMSDAIIKVEISNAVNSLNVANSAAIILYEITKKRLQNQ
jgi:RNA methyltransferase, TrmH family